MINYLWWVPLVCLFYVGYAWLSLKNNASTGWSWPLILYLYGGVFQLWVPVSKISKNVLFDSFVFDFFMAVSFSVTIVVLSGTKLSPYQILGMGLSISGLLLIRLT